MGEIRDLRPIACRSGACTAERRALLARVREAERMLAWFHDRCRSIWVEEQQYADTSTYNDVVIFLGTGHETYREPEDSADQEPGPGALAR